MYGWVHPADIFLETAELAGHYLDLIFVQQVAHFLVCHAFIFGELARLLAGDLAVPYVRFHLFDHNLLVYRFISFNGAIDNRHRAIGGP